MKSRVRIGYQVDFPPFMYQDETPAGLVIEALTPSIEAFRSLELEVEWVPLSLSDQERALIDGDVDLLAGLGMTPERAAKLVFGQPLVRTGGALFVKPGTGPVERIVTPTSGPLRHATGEAFPECEVLDAEDYPDALAKVVAGEADAAALNLQVGGVVAEREHAGVFELPSELFAAVDLAPAFAPVHDATLRRLLDVPR